MIFAGMGLEHLIYYIVSLSVLRLLSAVIVSEIARGAPSLALLLYRWSPLFMVASALMPWFSIHVFESLLLLMPVFSGIYLGSFWGLHFDVSQCIRVTTEDYQFTEVAASAIGGLSSAALTVFFGADVAVAFGGAFVMAGAILPLDVCGQEFEEKLSEWSQEAIVREKGDISNGLKIVIGVAVLNWTSLSTLRIGALVGVSPLMGVISLSLALSLAELFGYLITKGIEIGNGSFKLFASGLAIFGFIVMGLGGPIWSGVGYWFVSISSRIYWRVYDRKIARPALRGLGGRPGSREIRRYLIFMACCPLLAFPEILPYLGIGSVILLITTNGISHLEQES